MTLCKSFAKCCFVMTLPMSKQQHFWHVTKIFYNMSTTCCMPHVMSASYLVSHKATCTSNHICIWRISPCVHLQWYPSLCNIHYDSYNIPNEAILYVGLYPYSPASSPCTKYSDSSLPLYPTTFWISLTWQPLYHEHFQSMNSNSLQSFICFALQFHSKQHALLQCME